MTAAEVLLQFSPWLSDMSQQRYILVYLTSQRLEIWWCMHALQLMFGFWLARNLAQVTATWMVNGAWRQRPLSTSWESLSDSKLWKGASGISQTNHYSSWALTSQESRIICCRMWRCLDLIFQPISPIHMYHCRLQFLHFLCLELWTSKET